MIFFYILEVWLDVLFVGCRIINFILQIQNI